MKDLQYFSVPGIFDPETLPVKYQLVLFRSYQRAINVNMICSITDPLGRIIFANDIFCEISGFSRDELTGQRHSIVNCGFHSKEFFSNLWQTITAGNVWEGEIRNKSKSGNHYWVDTVILPIFSPEGKIIQFLSLRYLITAKKKNEFEKEQLVLSLQKMLQMTSHQVRKPVASLLGILQLIKNTPAESMSPDFLKKLTDYLGESIHELDDFTRELTLFMHEVGADASENQKN